MYNFDNYTLVVYETSKDYHSDVPDHRFVAYLKEIAEASLHEYGSTQVEAISSLRSQFDEFVNEAKREGFSLPGPESRDQRQFSGRIVLRMPPWLHRAIDALADEEGSSTNSYIVNRLIRAATMEELLDKMTEKEENFVLQLTYAVETQQSEIRYTKGVSRGAKLYALKGHNTEYNFKKTG
jgi:predicted HicB family RNase H-like nuclease